MQLDDLLLGLPEQLSIKASDVAREIPSDVVYIVLDDDPTGTQSVTGLPVLTRWSQDDFAWAFEQNTAAVYVLTNSRSLDEDTTRTRSIEVVRAATSAASAADKRVRFVSRSDSTLRGHFPLETDVLTRELVQIDEQRPAYIVLIPAFPDAGRITVHGVHYWVVDGEATPVAETPFAKDATFGYASSHLGEWVEEKTAGGIPAADVVMIPIETIRSGVDAVVQVLRGVPEGSVIAPDVIVEEDMRVIALALLRLETEGKIPLLRIGPPYMRAHIGQEIATPIDPVDVEFTNTGGGLVVVGSHVPLTTSQLDHLVESRPDTVTIELDARTLLSDRRDLHLEQQVAAAVAAIQDGTIIVHTSRELITGRDADDSLDIARKISSALVDFVARMLEAAPPRFVIAKGGITSSDTASEALGIARGTVVGPMLPGIVSLWQPRTGPALGIPYVVFAGNVGDTTSLTEVVGKLAD